MISRRSSSVLQRAAVFAAGAVAWILAVPPVPALAGAASVPGPSAGGGGRPPVRQTLTVSGLYAPEADLADKPGAVTQANAAVSYSVFMPLSREWFFRGGPSWQGFFFDSENPLVPEQLQEFGLETGFGRRLGGDWTAVAWVTPSLASDMENLDSGDFNVTGVAGAMWRPSDTFEFLAGARWSVHSNYPVLPAAGFKWKFAPGWELDLMAPQPELVWSAAENLKLIAGAALSGGAFRVGEEYARAAGRPELAGEWLGFREIRVYGAAELAVWKGGSARIEAGWMADREFEFVDEGGTIEVDGGFYAGAALRLSF